MSRRVGARSVQVARYVVATGAKAHLRRLAKAREVTPVRLRPGLHEARVLAVVVARDERVRLQAFLDHYRRAGVEHFAFIDNASTDGSVEQLLAQDDVSVWRADGEYRRARFGIDWVNHVLARHARGRWVLLVDVDELLVAEGEVDGLVPRLVDQLEGAGRTSAQALMLDMYSDRPATANHLAEGQDPLEVTPLFDAWGYHRNDDWRTGTTWVKGGVRGRLYFADDVQAGPALNKTPLVRWSPLTAFVKSAHEVWPRGRNGAFAAPAAALLHFKFTSVSAERILDPENRRQHTSEYEAYGALQEEQAMTGAPTTRYRSSQDLVDLGLITPVRPGAGRGGHAGQE